MGSDKNLRVLLLIHRIIVKNCFTWSVPILLWTPPELSVTGFTLFFMATDLRTALRMYEAGARAILDVDWSVEIDDQLLDGVRRMDRVERQLPAGRSAALAEVKVRGLAGQHGCRTAAAFLRQLLNCSAAEAGIVAVAGG